jgi:hypothetical protein
MDTGFPLDTAPTSAAFLSDALKVGVVVLDVSFMEGGVLSDAYRVRLASRDLRAAVPSSVVVKVPSSTKERQEFAVSVDAYTKELNFYQQLAADVPVRSPKIYACLSDGSSTVKDFVIVMEDLTEHSKVFDQIEDPPGETFARRIALEAAKLHAAYWESPVTRLPWVGRSDGRYVFSLDALCRVAPSTSGLFAEQWQAMFGEDLFAGFDDIRELTAILCGPRCNGIHDRIYEIFSSRPKTLLHGDMRADNIFRTVSADGSDGDTAQLTFIDWQVVHAGPPGGELTEAWMHSLEPEVRRNDSAFLREYHDRLLALNPAAATYSYEMLLEDYTLAFCFWWTAIITLGVGTVPSFDRPEGARMRRLWKAGAHRSFVAMRDLDCLSRIKEVAASIPPDAEPEMPIGAVDR